MANIENIVISHYLSNDKKLIIEARSKLDGLLSFHHYTDYYSITMLRKDLVTQGFIPPYMQVETITGELIKDWERRNSLGGIANNKATIDDYWARKQQSCLGMRSDNAYFDGMATNNTDYTKATMPHKGTHKREGLIIVIGVCLVFWGIVAALLI